MFKVPILFSASKSGRVFVLNPHRYEISVYADYKLAGAFKGKSDIFDKPAPRGRGFIFPAAYILDAGKRIYVTIRKPGAKSGHEMDVFEDGRQIEKMTLPGIPFAIDPQGRLYCAEEEGYPRIVRYVVEK